MCAKIWEKKNRKLLLNEKLFTLRHCIASVIYLSLSLSLSTSLPFHAFDHANQHPMYFFLILTHYCCCCLFVVSQKENCKKRKKIAIRAASGNLLPHIKVPPHSQWLCVCLAADDFYAIDWTVTLKAVREREN